MIKNITTSLVFLLLICGTVAGDNWNVTWIPISESIIEKEYIIIVQNLQDVKKDVNISSFFAETNFNISKVEDIEFYEWKLIPYTYTINHYDEINYSEYDFINDTWYIREESIFNFTETIESEKLGWKKCKSNLFGEIGTTKEDNYGFINIPKLNSKNESTGTYNGTKKFKLKFRTPIVYNGKYGSTGKVAILLDNVEYHPYWNTSWLSQKEIILTGDTSGAQTDYQILLNVTYETGMQTDFDDLRFTNDTHEIDSWLESKVNNSYALVWVEFPTTPANGVNQTYYMYYGNAEVINNWDGAATFPSFFYDFEDGTTTGWTEGMTTFEASTTQAKHGLYSLKTQSNSWQYGYDPISAINYPVAYDFYIYSHRNDQVKQFGLASASIADRTNSIYAYASQSGYFGSYNGSSHTNWNVNYNAGQWYHVRIVAYPVTDTYDAYVDDMITPAQTGLSTWGSFSGTIQSVYVRNENSIQYYDSMYIHKYVTNPSSYAFSREKHYTSSIHYNTTNPYNHTIESSGTIIANRSIIVADDINWTAAAVSNDCQMVVTEYNLINTTITNFTLCNASLDWLRVTNLTVGGIYNLTNSTIYEKQTVDVNGEVNFTSDLIPGCYQILFVELSIEPSGLLVELKLIMSEITNEFKNINMGNYLVYAFILIGILLIIFIIQLLSKNVYRG